ncbi:hypothetical protein VTJ83DRAFT_7139 [Remersonia thermophila]|uniref:Cyclin N-terminal domain-containing protein n=1 Tax=Remersonia thermophila TaxID=72144 RepID=A0ABR4D4V9_9PEZI
MDYPSLSMAELNAAALEHFIYQPVDKQMIRYLAKAASNVIQCDPNMMPPKQQQQQRQQHSSHRRDPSPRAVRSTDGALPTVEEFITQLVISSNVQVPTLMSSLVYLRRLKSRLQPAAKGLRCTTHRIFLASLILAAKYLNDSSPKNKHWANYSIVQNHAYNFGFSRTEVNLMEKQLLFLLDWDLRISEEDLYYELDPFLEPIRNQVAARHARRMQRKQEQEMRERLLEEERRQRAREREEEARMWMALMQPKQASLVDEEAALSAASASSPDSYSGSSSRSRSTTASHSRSSSRDVSPPGLYSSGSSSYAESSTSRATSPYSDVDLTDVDRHQPYIYDAGADGLCDSPMDVTVVPDDAESRPIPPEKDAVYAIHAARIAAGKKRGPMLPYEITAEDLRAIEESGRHPGTGAKGLRNVFGRFLGAAR